MSGHGGRVRGWERWLLRAALASWPTSDREEASGVAEVTLEEKRRARGRGGLLPEGWDTLREAANLVATGLRLRFGDRGQEGWGMGMKCVVRHGLRGAARSPRWAFLVVIVLATAIGSTVAVFTVVDAVALRPLPYDRPEELLRLGSTREGRPGLSATSGPNFRDLEAEATLLSSVAAAVPGSIAVTGPGGVPELLRGAWVSGSFFRTLGRTALLGRPLAPPDDGAEAPLVVVLSHALWQSMFGGAPVVGSTVMIEDRAATVVGIMPPDFHPPEGMHLGGTALWAPLGQASFPLEERDLAGLDMIGRIADGASPDAVDDELGAIGRGIAETYGLDARGFTGFASRPLIEETLGDASATLRLMGGAVTLLLAIACLNVVSLVLLRTLDRADSLWVRLSLGASRLRVVAEATTETVLLAFVAGALGTAAAWAAVGAVRRSAPVDLPRLVEVGLDARVALAALVLSLVVGVGVGVPPAAWVLARGRGTFPRGGRAESGSRGARRAREGLVLAQVSLGLALAVGAGLLMQSLARLHRVDPGFDPGGVVVTTLSIRGIGGDDFDPSILDRMLEEVGRLPGVTSVSLSSGSPYVPGGRVGYVDPVGADIGDDERVRARIEFHRVSGDHLTKLGMRFLQGRDVASSDREDSEPVVVISESLAGKLWPSGDALGARLVVGGDGSFTPRTIVGIVRSPRYRGPGAEPEEHVWMPYRQMPLQPLDLVLRVTEGVPVRRELATVLDRTGGTVRMRLFRRVEGAMAEHFTEPAFFTTLLSAFAAMALLLAAVGLYATLAHGVQSRRRELGVRLALGADATSLTRGVVLHGGVVTCLGVAAGLGLALAGTRVLAAFLFDTAATDPTVWAGACGVMLVVGALASWIPARAAGGVDPATSLRAD